MNRAIIIMAKVPRAGKVKTRLVPFLTFEQAAELSSCFLADTIEKVKKLDARLIIAFGGAREFFDCFSLGDALFIEQKGGDLGEKMFNAFEFAFRQKSDSVVMIGTDSPTVPPKFIERAFDFLEKSDAVLGKTADGGFYLIGLRHLKREIFENVEWSSANAFRQTKENILRLGWKLNETPDWYDVDEPADLEKLAQDRLLKQNAPQTFEWIEKKL